MKLMEFIGMNVKPVLSGPPHPHTDAGEQTNIFTCSELNVGNKKAKTGQSETLNVCIDIIVMARDYHWYWMQKAKWTFFKDVEVGESQWDIWGDYFPNS